jgi:hypothetical protein
VTQTGIVAIVSGGQDVDGNAAASATSNSFAVETSLGGGGVISGPLSIGFHVPIPAGTTTSSSTGVSGTTAGRGTTPPSVSPAHFNFTRDLRLGSKGSDVIALQKYLNAHGFTLANYGPGSPGNETRLFGRATQYQLKQFQIANGITPALGYYGPKTRAAINK